MSSNPTMILDGLAVVVVMIPTIVYVGTAFHIDPLQLGIIMVMITQIGGLTPPVALLLFITTSIARVPFMDGVRQIWPFLGVIVGVMIAIMVFPGIATWLPGRMLGSG